MYELEPGTFAWNLYAYYYCLGGRPYRPEEGIGVLLRRLFIWLPFRWLFAWENRIPAVLWAACVMWSAFSMAFAINLLFFALGMLLMNDIYQIVQYFTRERYDAGSDGSMPVCGMSETHHAPSQQH